MRLSLALAWALFALLPSHAPAADAERVVNIYNWADYIGPTTIRDFEAEFGVEVNYDIYDTSEIVDAKLMAGGSGYDVMVHAASYSARLLAVGLYRPLDKSKLTNWDNLDPALLDSYESFDPGVRYSVPYMWGTTGFSYNVDMVLERIPDAPLDSAAMIFDPAITSRLADCGISYLDSPIDVLPMALMYLGLESNSMAPEDLRAAEMLIKKVRPHLRYFDSTKMLNDMPNKDICLALSWSGDYATALIRAQEAGIDINLAYTIPREGAGSWFDAMFIPADAPHPHNAHLFINYMLRPEVIAAATNFVNYANANRAATPFVDPRVLNDPAIYPTAEEMRRLEPQLVQPPKVERLRTRVWTRIKTGL